ncbi:MAG: GNAT family N-acetyltransferase [Betaproteobacteria bacterium]|nr:GNAT family N-acetyltransferase [Betaproteobacteria bacterium]
MNLQWQIERFDALELRQLYQLLQLRQAVFAVEQQGHALLRRAIDCCALFDGNEGGVQAIRISAQAYLEPFYRVHGFAPQGDCYIEDGIKHLEMLRSGESLVQDKNK